MKNDHLWELIHKISPTEKAYFKKQSSTHSNNVEYNYLKLFDELNSILKFDIHKIDLVYKSYHQSARLKNYLYELILSSLESYANNNNKIFQSKRNLLYARILYEKGLLYKCKKFTEKCIELATDNYDYYTQLEAISFQKKIYAIELKIPEVEALIKEEKKTFAIIDEINQYELLLSSISNFSFSRGNIVNEKEKKQIVIFSKNKIFNTADNCKSIVAKSLHFRILTLCSAMTNDPKNNYLYALNRFKAIENSSYIFVDIQNYINTLSNLSWAAIDNEKYMEAEFYTKKFADIKTTSVFLESRVLARRSVCELRIILAAKKPFNYKQCQTIANECLKYPNNLIRMDEKLEILLFIITLCFNNLMFKEARVWFSIYFKLPKSEVRVDIQCYLLLINIYIHYLTKDFEYVNYLMKNAINQFLEKEMMNVDEAIIFDFIQNHLSIKPSANGLEEIKEKIMSINENGSALNLGKYIIYPVDKISSIKKR
jgi:hypothetical protein